MTADKYQIQTTDIPFRAFAKDSVHLIVDLPLTQHGNKNIVVMIDHLTGWPMAKAISDKEAATVANAIYKKLILEHTCLQILLSDNGKEFTNNVVDYAYQEHNIVQHFTSPYMPQSNGKTKNLNKFLKVSIRKLCQDASAVWD